MIDPAPYGSTTVSALAVLGAETVVVRPRPARLIEQLVRLVGVVAVPVGGLLAVAGGGLADAAVALERDDALADGVDDQLAVEAVRERLAHLLVGERTELRVERQLLRATRGHVLLELVAARRRASATARPARRRSR